MTVILNAPGSFCSYELDLLHGVHEAYNHGDLLMQGDELKGWQHPHLAS
jgi:hypothetical protein